MSVKTQSRACVIRFRVELDKFLNHVVGYGWEEDAQIAGYGVGSVRTLVSLADCLVLFIAKQ